MLRYLVESTAAAVALINQAHAKINKKKCKPKFLHTEVNNNKTGKLKIILLFWSKGVFTLTKEYLFSI